jgi:hypothetical protein
MLTQFTNWLWHLLVGLVTPFWNFLTDLVISLFDGVVSAFVALIVAIPVPSFIAGGLGQYWGGLDQGVMYFVSAAGVPAALGLIGAGYAFRLVRKFATLFQW